MSLNGCQKKVLAFLFLSLFAVMCLAESTHACCGAGGEAFREMNAQHSAEIDAVNSNFEKRVRESERALARKHQKILMKIEKSYEQKLLILRHVSSFLVF